MTGHSAALVDEVTPDEAWSFLNTDFPAAMVDVRTQAEWAFVGVPEISATGKPFWPVEWAMFPSMAPNARFVETLLAQAGGNLPDRVFFICRSGARSMSAAHAVSEAMAAVGAPLHCSNVAEGFEGVLDAEGHRGTHNGWKARGLPWRQS